MEHVDNIQIRQTWVEEQTDLYAKELKIPIDEAFTRLVAGLILDINPGDIDPADIIDGGQDKQIDIIHIEDDQEKGYAEIIIIQAKNTNGFSSNIAIQIRNGLDWIFGKKIDDVNELKNQLFKNKIQEIRGLRKEYGASNLNVSVYHITCRN